MSGKILKIELFVLFLITVIAFCAFYYNGLLPDNYFEISSRTESSGFFGYYLTSFIAVVGYYTGPWIFFVFFTFALFYSFLFSKREFAADPLNVIPLTGATLLSAYIFCPVVIGQGLRTILDLSVNMWVAFLVDLLCIIGFFAGAFRAAFRARVTQTFKFMLSAPQKISDIKHQITYKDPTKKYRTTQKGPLLGFSSVKLKVSSLLTGDKKDLDKKKPAFNGLQPKGISMSSGTKEPVSAPVRAEAPVKDEEQLHMFNNGSKDSVDEVEQPKSEVVVSEAPDTSNAGEGEAKKSTLVLRKSEDAVQIQSRYAQVVSCLKSMNHDSRTDVPDSYFGEIINVVESKLAEFNIQGSIINVLKGPVVDTFELELGPGVKVSGVSNRSDDLSLALRGVPIRVVYPMEGKTTVGIEVPRSPREIIYLDQIINSKTFSEYKGALPIAMGKDAYGDVMLTDLATMPHMLVAGATGSGKSVFINTVLISLLVKKNPKQLKLLLIDPKQLELAMYGELPHLIMPVITDHATAACSLLWAVQEMERRYTILAEFGVRGIGGFNDKLKTATPEQIAKIHHHYEGQPDDEGYELPYVVIIVDEFADLILTKSGKEIEHSVNRLAAKARAAGIHLIVATQRPSVKVITGNIKANFPSRVAFKVIGGVDSRTILDHIGAEKLLGMGDMLFCRGVSLKRVHSSFIGDEQTQELCSELAKIPSSFIPGAMEFVENGGDPQDEGNEEGAAPKGISKKDDRYDEALDVVRQKGMASASMLQRSMGIGYPKAAKIIDQMEANGVIGPQRGSKPREVLY